MASDSRDSAAAPLPDAGARARAVDPDRSVLVQAPAGSGKTSLLVERYLNLLERVERPEEILALTFTRKAAAEMRKRVVDALGADDERAARVRMRDRALDWQLALSPQRLRIQTIDSFAFDVASLDARAAGGAPMIAREPQRLYESAADHVFQRLMRPDPFHDEICAFLDLHQNDHARAHRALVGLLEHREQWLDAVRAALTDVGVDRVGLARRLASSIDALHRTAIADVARYLATDALEAMASIGGASAQALGLSWADATEVERWRHVARVLITEAGRLRRRFDARVGLPASDPTTAAARARAAALVPTISREAVAALAWLRDLPEPHVDAEELAALSPIAVTLALAASALADAFAERGTVDFAELTSLARRALGEHGAPTDLALALDYRVQHVLVDEFQDTSAAQIDLLRRVVAGWQPGDGRTFFGVGDPMQSIYRFRDADVSLYLAAATEGIGGYPLEPVVLERNFRSRPAIVDWCNTVLGAAFGSESHRATGSIAYAPASAQHHDEVGAVDLVGFEPDDAVDPTQREAAFLAAQVARLRAQHPDHSIAVLVRNRVYAEPLLAQLDAAAVPWHGADIRLLGDEPVVRDLVALHRLGGEPTHRLALLTLLRAPLVGVGLEDLVRLARHASLHSAVIDRACALELSADGAARIARLRPLLVDLPRAVAELPPRQWLENTWLRLGGSDAYDDAALAQADAFFPLVERETPERPDCETLERALGRLFARPTGGRDDVQIMTIHRAKGLEFDHVLVPALDRPGGADDAPAILAQIVDGHALVGSAAHVPDGSLYAWLRRQAAARDANERVRLAYVAATRARRSLMLTAVVPRDADWAPDPRSLLAAIWPHARGQLRYAEASAGAPTAAAQPAVILRLPADYRWSPPSDAMLSTEPDVDAPGESPQRDLEYAVRSVLAELALEPRLRAVEAGHDARRRRIAMHVRASSAANLVDLEQRIEALVDTMLDDPVGAWLLDRPGEVDVELRGVLDGRTVGVSVDRTFLDAAGTRWLIAYDASLPGGAPRPHHDRARRVALARAAALARALEDRPVRAALFEVARRRLTELADHADSSSLREPIP